MANGRCRRRSVSRPSKASPHSLKTCHQWRKHPIHKKPCKTVEVTGKKDWEDITCSVCMECPHNAVLLLCSSHDKGCRPYMCGTSYRYSNCLDQFKKAYGSKGTSASNFHDVGHTTVPISDSEDFSLEDGSAGIMNLGPFQSRERWELSELSCPLCRGKVKGCTIVESARAYLNNKKRSCVQDGCSYVGTYEELRKHVHMQHPSARPQEVDPVLQQNWRRLEHEREHDDVLTTIRSTMPGAMVFGDYVIEGNGFGSDGERGVGTTESNFLNILLFFQAFGHNGETDSGYNFASRLRRLARGYRRLEMGSSGLSRTGWEDEMVNITPDEDESARANPTITTLGSSTVERGRTGNREDSARRCRSRRRWLTDLT